MKPHFYFLALLLLLLTQTLPAWAQPTPADATLTLRQPADTQLTLYNAQDRAMYRGKASAQPAQVDTRAWPAGLYYLHTGTGRTSQRHQLQIQH
ncbi:T9SS type A sorting domain-containing protein [Hymenobacter yonginensis]|uniref:T9SS type A sorting domain-containing protein n=1 Tax=Hymenobacter yonginensis TaxID=748197 RepID=A0ABY7PND4_9BACT|nr:T9SS type A sorting domain-containing protein [Hymenobacter yonginensis]WBO84281.1 T9SS type A sorting domain-containing protein [Hymenobacter yonginensis]